MARESIIPKPVTEYDLRLLRIFLVVVEHGGFSAAENALGITRSTISVHMTNLESRMQLTLCRRGRSGFSLTEEGQMVYHGVNKLFESLEDFSLLVGNLGKDLSGELVIMSSDQLDEKKQRKLASVIEQLHDKAPNLHIVLDGDTLSNIEKQILKDKVHVGILPQYQSVEGLEYIPLSSEPNYLCCGEQHPFFGLLDSEIDANLFAQAYTIHPGIDLKLDGMTQLRKLNLNAKSYQFDMRKTMILSGKYLGYMPQSYIQQELNQGRIRIIQPSLMTYQFDLSLVRKRSPREPNKVDLVMNVIGNVFDL
ncbi:LysR family transcriptional regulator [Vibrio agarivorans]|uniref:LysR family transcriptional regulator n=1 Tax=Vibrio agarivorans TaxID=153622 RepID=UPI0025B499F4|nr:LysR family transcriptional regulator [Vibrio agarivorans]MDN3663493.1 LysR family transcriptional regulator [Vibrio agarivorans]